MKLLKSSLAAFGLIVMMAGCSNPTPQGNGPTAECSSDSNCNSSDACRVCQGGRCVTLTDCCTTDAQCPGRECTNEKGKAYGRCR